MDKYRIMKLVEEVMLNAANECEDQDEGDDISEVMDQVLELIDTQLS